jgi:FKBP-type peptidyl-prolyl cis-trans isomerase FkpA
MKKISILSLLFIFFLSSCSKKEDICAYTESPIVASTAEINAVQAYLGTNGISATQAPSGFFYAIDAPGTGTIYPGLCSNVAVEYTGKLTDGTVFDKTTGQAVLFTLGTLIVGWQKGLPLIKAGGKIRLYIPPSLGYGSVANGNIPKNSILIFDITMDSVQ